MTNFRDHLDPAHCRQMDDLHVACTDLVSFLGGGGGGGGQLQTRVGPALHKGGSNKCLSL